MYVAAAFLVSIIISTDALQNLNLLCALNKLIGYNLLAGGEPVLAMVANSKNHAYNKCISP